MNAKKRTPNYYDPIAQVPRWKIWALSDSFTPPASLRELALAFGTTYTRIRKVADREKDGAQLIGSHVFGFSEIDIERARQSIHRIRAARARIREQL